MGGMDYKGSSFKLDLGGVFWMGKMIKEAEGEIQKQEITFYED